MRLKSRNLTNAEMPRHPESMLNRSLPNIAHSGGLGFDGNMPEQIVKKKRSWKKIFKRTFLTLLTLTIIAGGWVGWKFVSNSAKIFGWNNLFGWFHTTKLDGEDQGRVTILLAGNSADDPGHGGANLTDSIMLVSINTKTNKAFLLSIPRDLYVNIPNHGYAKINETYQDGEADNFAEAGYAKGGMGLLEKVVAENFGMTSNYYALVNYAALRDAVNAVGGVQINVQSSDPRGLYDPSPDLATRQPLVDLANGVHTLNGQQALDLARARGDSYGAYGFPRGDFNRTDHQRQIIVALKDKASSVGTLSNPIKLGELFDSFGGNIKTDLNVSQVRRAYSLMKKIPSNDIASAALNNGTDRTLLKNYTTPYGQSALIPTAGVDDFSGIQAYVQQLEAQ
ncbi:MAG TPA: LCP family protein [Candidatus Saccharimonadales bacterium]|nr:LCP family protein [Candidatus Saccharimonadales bacterium]